MAKLISGKRIAERMQREIRLELTALEAEGRRPQLVAIQVGDEPSTRVYIERQHRQFDHLGLSHHHLHLPGRPSRDAVLEAIHRLNGDPQVSGILLTMPLPEGLSAHDLQLRIDPWKDVEGMHPMNLGQLVKSETGLEPCTAVAIREAIRETGTELPGAEAVVVGHSDIVGKPIVLMLLREDVSTTCCHARTRDLAEHTRRAEILIVATGKPKLIRMDMVLPGAVVIDVGIRRIKDPASGRLRVTGDVDFEGVSRVASWITPVPGGIGPITVAALARNTVIAARRQLGKR